MGKKKEEKDFEETTRAGRLNHARGVDKDTRRELRDRCSRRRTAPRYYTRRHRNSCRNFSYGAVIGRPRTGGCRSKDVINRGALNIPAEDAFIAKFDGVVKAIGRQRAGSRETTPPTFLIRPSSHLRGRSSSRRARRLSSLVADPISRARTNLTSIKSRINFRPRLMTKRRRPPLRPSTGLRAGFD